MLELKLYQEELLDHYKYPRNSGSIPDADIKTGSYNPSCGDAVSLDIKLEQLVGENQSGVIRVQDIKFEGSGCVISVASASILTEYIKNKELTELEKIDHETMLLLVKIPLGPTRLRCALLVLEALQAGIEKYRNIKKL